jgi:enediyne biosynthesis protein E4
LEVTWGKAASGPMAGTLRRIDASGLTLRMRRGPPLFEKCREEQVRPPEHAHSVDPLLVYDLDGDGRSEVILAGKNLVYRWRPEGGYRAAALCDHAPGVLTTALVADFEGDGRADFLCATLKGLVLYSGSADGRFDGPGRLVWPAPTDWKYPMVLSAGDVDGDGDLDLFVGQYKVPYEDGVMPTPYYDANDGDPDYLLANDGRGEFSDVTVAAGLGAKQGRRTYSGSLVDMDDDGDLDLVVISDFAGVDLYRNDGHGRFTDVTDVWVDDPRAFGMSHALADFDRDGRLDLLMLGMTSPTVDRLEHLGLWPADVEEDRPMRARMMHGNRLYLSRPDGGYVRNRLSESVARSGWSWGCGAADFDNDGWVDLFVANGLESRASVRDYESEYWLHDRYVGSSEPDAAVYYYFRGKFGRTRGRGQSYGGYERNRLYWNLAARRFIEMGHLAGVGSQQDSRNVVATDLDGDGRVDLVVTGFGAWPDPTHRVWLYENRWPEAGHWIGFRFREGGPGRSPIGVRVRLAVGGETVQRQIVSGDSYRSQHPLVVHFGLGARQRIDRVDIRWTSGDTLTIEEPAVNRYHDIMPP